MKSKNHFKIFSDSMRLLLGVSSETFKLTQWIKSPWWGYLKFYSFEDFYGELENIFEIAYEKL